MTPTTVEVMIEGARNIEASFDEPDDDWMPALALTNSAGEVAVVDVLDFFQSDQTRQLLSELVLPKLVEDTDVQELVLVTSVWVLELTPKQWAEGFVRPRDNPDQKEVLRITRVTAEGTEAWHAAITRDGVTPPKLGEFVKQEGLLEGLTDPVAAVMAKRRRGTNGDSMPGL